MFPESLNEDREGKWAREVRTAARMSLSGLSGRGPLKSQQIGSLRIFWCMLGRLGAFIYQLLAPAR